MKTATQRVIAIDYFRGLCMIAVILTHAAVFSYPFNYLVGAGRLWTGAAEMFFLLSGITLWIVRGNKLAKDFWGVTKKTWKRAGLIYIVGLAATLASISIAVLLTARGLPTGMPSALPAVGLGHLFLNALLLKYSFGWASFLIYYSAFLLIAPLALHLLRTRFWALVPLASAGLFAATLMPAVAHSPYFYFFVWQVYFFIGLTIGRLRLPILSRFNALPARAARGLAYTIATSAGLILAFSAFLSFKTAVVAGYVAERDWVPNFINAVPTYLATHQGTFNHLLQAGRSGLLRPVAAVWVLAGLYVVYQKNKTWLLSKTGWFVNPIGSKSMSVFVAQALALPIFAALPIAFGNAVTDFLMTAAFISCMWLVAKPAVLGAILTACGEPLNQGLVQLRAGLNSLKPQAPTRDYLSRIFS